MSNSYSGRIRLNQYLWEGSPTELGLLQSAGVLGIAVDGVQRRHARSQSSRKKDDIPASTWQSTEFGIPIPSVPKEEGSSLACSFGWSANIDRIGGDSRCYTPFLIIKLRLIQFKW